MDALSAGHQEALIVLRHEFETQWEAATPEEREAWEDATGSQTDIETSILKVRHSRGE